MHLAFRQTHLYRFVNIVCPTGFEPATFGVGVMWPYTNRVHFGRFSCMTHKIWLYVKQLWTVAAQWFIAVFSVTERIVVWTAQRSWCTVQQSDPVDKLFHVLNVGIRCVFGIDFRWVQNDDLHSICPQSLQRPRQTASLIWSFAEIGNASLLIKYFCNNIYFSVTLPCPLL